MSDAKLLERLQSDWAAQLFCGIYLGPGQRIADTSLVSRVRSSLGRHCCWESLQKALMLYWKKELVHPHLLVMDATCYESYIRYPSDAKLLWESCVWIFEKGIYKLCKALRIARPRSTYRSQKSKYLTYSRLRKKSHRKTRKRIQSLLRLLSKGLGQLRDLVQQYPEANTMLSKTFWQRLLTTRQVQQQQAYLYHTPVQERDTMPDRIVSLHKPYLGPIVRGKENKRVEFGHKAQVIQVGGLNFIEYLHPQAFNESTRLASSLRLHQQYLGDCKQLGADRIYATRQNRKLLKTQDIHHNFTPLGRKPQKTDANTRELRKHLNKIRSTQLEGSFGNEKNHYGLQKNKAQGLANEQVWIFFGVQTANAVKIFKQRAKQEDP